MKGQLQQDIEKILDSLEIAHGPGSDVRFWTAEEWSAKERVPIEKCSVLSMTFEGPFYHLVNYERNTYEEVQGAAKKHGYYGEFGFSWSMHFWPIKGE